MGSTARRSDPALWEQVKQGVTAGDKGGAPGQWSARKAQFAVQDYKRRGGGYEGGKRADNALRQWTREQAAPHDTRDASKAELMQEARRRGVPGRSRMDKAALRHALR